MSYSTEDLSPHLLRLRIIWLAIAQAVVIYAVLLWFLTARREAGSEMPAFVPMVLGVAGVGASLLSFVLKGLLLDPERVAAMGQGANLPSAIGALIRGLIVVWAAAESCSIIGFVIGMVSDRMSLAYILIAAGGAFVLSQPPTETMVRDFLSALEIAHQRRQGD